MSEKCSPDDPRRCQGVTANGQCEYLAREGEKFCTFHSKGASDRRFEKKEAERYLIDNADLRQSYLRQRDDKDYLDLKDEILLVQAVLERRLNAIRTDADMMMAIGPVTQLIQRLESMKISLMKIQQQLGLVLGKDHLRALAAQFASILDEELDGVDGKEDRMERICERLFEAIEQSGKQESE